MFIPYVELVAVMANDNIFFRLRREAVLLSVIDIEEWHLGARWSRFSYLRYINFRQSDHIIFK